MARRVPLSVGNLQNMTPASETDGDDMAQEPGVPMTRKAKKRQLKKALHLSRKRCVGAAGGNSTMMNLSLSAARSHHIKDTSLNSSTLKQTLRANNRALARALELKRRELHLAEQQLVLIQSRDAHDEVRSRLQRQVCGMKGVLNEVCEQLLHTVQLIHSALDADLCSVGEMPGDAANDDTPVAANPVLEDEGPVIDDPVAADLDPIIDPETGDDPITEVITEPVIEPDEESASVEVPIPAPSSPTIITGTMAVAALSRGTAMTTHHGAADLSMIMEQSVLTENVPLLFCGESATSVTSRHTSSRSHSSKRILPIAEEQNNCNPSPPPAPDVTPTVASSILFQPAVDACSAFGMRPAAGTVINPDDRPITGTGAVKAFFDDAEVPDDDGDPTAVEVTTASTHPPSPAARSFLKRHGGVLSYAARGRKAPVTKTAPKPSNPPKNAADDMFLMPPPPAAVPAVVLPSSGILSEDCNILLGSDMEHSIYDVQDMEFTGIINEADVKQIQAALNLNTATSVECTEDPQADRVIMDELCGAESTNEEQPTDGGGATTEDTTGDGKVDEPVSMVSATGNDDSSPKVSPEKPPEVCIPTHQDMPDVDKGFSMDRDRLRHGTVLLKAASTSAQAALNRRGTVVLKKRPVNSADDCATKKDGLSDEDHAASAKKEVPTNKDVVESTKMPEVSDASDTDFVAPMRHSRRTVARPVYTELDETFAEVVSKKQSNHVDSAEKADVGKKKLKAQSVVAEKIVTKKKPKKPVEDVLKSPKTVPSEDGGIAKTTHEQAAESESGKSRSIDNRKADKIAASKENGDVLKKKLRKHATNVNEGDDVARKKKPVPKSESGDGNAADKKKSSSTEDDTKKTKSSSHVAAAAPPVVQDDILSSDDRRQEHVKSSGDGQLSSSDDDDANKKKHFTAFQTKPGTMAFHVGELSQPLSKRGGTSMLPRVSAAKARSKSRLPIVPPAPSAEHTIIGPKLPKSVYDLSMNESVILVRTNFTDFRDRCIEKTTAALPSTDASSTVQDGSHGIMLTLGNGKRTKPRTARGKKVSYAPAVVPESPTSSDDSPCVIAGSRKRHHVVSSSDEEEEAQSGKVNSPAVVGGGSKEMKSADTAKVHSKETEAKKPPAPRNGSGVTSEKMKSPHRAPTERKKKAPAVATGQKEAATGMVDAKPAAARKRPDSKSSQDRKSNASDRLATSSTVSATVDVVSSKRSRRCASSVSYKEPSLNGKMRQGDLHTENIYSDKKSAKSDTMTLPFRREALVDIPTNVIAQQ